ncbi:MAG: hypothetical protein WC763_06320 [Candidatus Paceibacterota bacterium]
MDLGINQLVSLPSFFLPDVARINFPFLRWMSLVDNCLIAPPPHRRYPGSLIVSIGAQRLPMTLSACFCSFDTNDGGGGVTDSNEPSAVVGFTLHLSTNGDDDESGTERKSMLPSSVDIADRNRLARRWPYFRRLLEAGLSEARSGHADLSPFFSLRLGQCLVDYFDGKPVQVSSLRTQDCHDLVEHADYFGLTDTLLFHFCTAKLKRADKGGGDSTSVK